MNWLTPGTCTGGVVGNRFPKHKPAQVVGPPTEEDLLAAIRRLARLT